MKAPLIGVDDLERGHRGGVGRLRRGEPGRELRADAFGKRPVDDLVARETQAIGKGFVGVDNRAALIAHDDQVCDRVESVLQLAPRADHVVEQLQVLDHTRELSAQLVGPIQQVELAARFDAHAVEDDRASAPPAAQHRDALERQVPEPSSISPGCCATPPAPAPASSTVT
jgi:hypothetical protein